MKHDVQLMETNKNSIQSKNESIKQVYITPSVVSE